MALWVHWFLCAMAFLLTLNITEVLHRMDRLVGVCVISGAMVSAIGIAQYTADFHWIPQAVAPGSTFANKNIAVQFVVMIWPLSLFLIYANKNRHRLWAYLLSFGLITLFLICSGTRAGWVAAVCAVFFYGCYQWTIKFRAGVRPVVNIRRMILYVFAVFCVFGGLFFYSKDGIRNGSTSLSPTSSYLDSAATTLQAVRRKLRLHDISDDIRMQLWNNTVDMIMDNPWTGVGFANWHIYYPAYHLKSMADPFFGEKAQPLYVHNDYIQVCAETGGIGLFLFMIIFLFPIRSMIIVHRQSADPALKNRSVFLFMAILCFAVNALFSFPLRMAIPPLFFMLFLALISALEIQVRPSCRWTGELSNRTQMGGIVLAVSLMIFVTVFNVKTILADYHYLNAAALQKQDRWAASADAIKRSLGFNPRVYISWFRLGKAFDAIGDRQHAVSAYQRALELHPNHLNSMINLGNDYLAAEDLVQAEKWIQKALAISPMNAKALFNMGVIQEKSGKSQKALDCYLRSIESDSRNPRSWVRAGIQYFNTGQLDEAERFLKEAKERGEDTFSAHFMLGNIYARRNKTDMAKKYYFEALEKYGPSAALFNQLGLMAAMEKDWSKAVEYYCNGLQTDPNLGALHVNLSVAYFVQKKYRLSREHALIGKKLGLSQAQAVLDELEKTE